MADCYKEFLKSNGNAEVRKQVNMKMFSVLRENQLEKFVTAEQNQPQVSAAENAKQAKEMEEKVIQGRESIVPM